MSGLVVVSEPTSLVAVNDQCAAVEAWAERCDSAAEVRDAINKLAAIDEYLKRTSTEGRERVAAAMRRLEVRVGKLLGKATRGAHSSANEGPALTPNERHAFRQMAEHEDTVERVIAQSTTSSPASRRKVTQAIAAGTGKLDKSREAVIERQRRVRQLAAEGHTSAQIGALLGVGNEGVLQIAKRIGITIPADAAVGRTRNKKHDPDRIVATIVHDLEGARISIGLIDFDALDEGLIPTWVSSLTESIKALQALKTALAKELNQ